ncbi:hypothetical protein B0H12DRAFT_102060 [Mycena haematopus]|nr:hypothetical protein B0H12DRAFT_102060 [Mycena haematopus]
MSVQRTRTSNRCQILSIRFGPFGYVTSAIFRVLLWLINPDRRSSTGWRDNRNPGTLQGCLDSSPQFHHRQLINSAGVPGLCQVPCCCLVSMFRWPVVFSAPACLTSVYRTEGRLDRLCYWQSNSHLNRSAHFYSCAIQDSYRYQNYRRIQWLHAPPPYRYKTYR